MDRGPVWGGVWRLLGAQGSYHCRLLDVCCYPLTRMGLEWPGAELLTVLFVGSDICHVV